MGIFFRDLLCSKVILAVTSMTFINMIANYVSFEMKKKENLGVTIHFFSLEADLLDRFDIYSAVI